MPKNLFFIFLFTCLLISCQDTSSVQEESARPKKGTSVDTENLASKKENKILFQPPWAGDAMAEDLFSGSYDNVQAILDEEGAYFDRTGRYTEDFSKLHITFKDVKARYFMPNDGQSRIYLKSGYYYVLTKDLVAVYYGNPRLGQEWYHLDFHFDGTSFCVAKTPEANVVCEALGGLYPTPNSRIPSWIMYELPYRFLEDRISWERF